MVEMIAEKEFRYGSRELVIGDRFEARERDVKLLTALRRARLPLASEKGRTGVVPSSYSTTSVADSPETRVMSAALPSRGAGRKNRVNSKSRSH